MSIATFNRTARQRFAAAGLALSMVGLTGAQAAGRREVLPVGTVIPVRSDAALSSKTAQPGDRISATVRYGNDDGGLPAGTRVEGVVREAMPSANGKPGVLDVDFRRIVFPGGQSERLDGSLYSLDAKSVKRTSSGRLTATNDKSKDRLKFVGIGAGAGLVISALTKGNALVDTLLGAGAGYLYNELKKDKPGDVNLKAGTEFGIRVEQQVAFNTTRPVYRPSSTDRYDREDDRDYDRNEDRRNDDRYYQRDRNDRDPADRVRDRRDDADRQDRGVYGDVDGNDIGMLVDDRNVGFGRNRPFLRGSTVMVPIEAASRAARFRYEYDAERRMIRARNGDARLAMGSRIAVLRGGDRRRLPAAAEMRGGQLYVPMQFIGIASGGSVSYDSGSHTIILNTERD